MNLMVYTFSKTFLYFIFLFFFIESIKLALANVLNLAKNNFGNYNRTLIINIRTKWLTYLEKKQTWIAVRVYFALYHFLYEKVCLIKVD